jgi:glycosyltransferase involved in cell wall biosynthesis
MTVAVVIPAFNEASSIGRVIGEIRSAVPGVDVVVVDDGSTDGTGAAAAAAGARVLSHPYNKGNGASVKTALRQVDAERIVIIDADGQHPPAMIPQLLDRLETHDLVVGARVASSEAPQHRRIGNWLFCKLAGLLSEREIPDLTSGFRAFNRAKALEFIHLYPNGFSFPTTSTLSFISAGYSVSFLPITAALRPANTSSHIRPLHDGLRFVLMIIRISTMINPLRVFVPAAMLCLFGGLAWSVRTLLLTSQISAAGAFLIGAGINILFFGIVVDQLAAIRLKGRD